MKSLLQQEININPFILSYSCADYKQYKKVQGVFLAVSPKNGQLNPISIKLLWPHVFSLKHKVRH